MLYTLWKHLLFAVIVAVCTADEPTSYGYKEIYETYKSNDRYFYYPKGEDYTIAQIDTNEPVDRNMLSKYSIIGATMTNYLLYTRSNPETPQPLVNGDFIKIIASNYNNRLETVFIIHGWAEDAESEMSQSLKEAFLEAGNINVIVVDWSALSMLGYVTAKIGVPSVGSTIGTFINWLVFFGTSYDRIHVVGFGTGAHVAGNAGRATRSRVQRITGLDPAWPLWSEEDKYRIVSTDARYVEIIHTSIYIFGYPHPCGDADFYPNGGQMMPGCFGPVCSHLRAYKYMYASVKLNHMLANQCDSVEQATGLFRFCSGENYLMGGSDLSKARSGIFRIRNRIFYPYF